MSRFLDPYYFVNSLLLLVYGGLRAYFVYFTPEGSEHSRFHSLHDLAAWEKQLMMLAMAFIAYKGLRMRSWDDYAQQMFFIGKLAVALSAIMVDMRLGVLYALAAVACWVAFPQPIIQMSTGRGESSISILTPLSMRDFVLRGEDDWVVFFYTENHVNSIATAPAFVEVAQKYASESLSFGVMDACLFQSFSRELKLRPNSWSNQLPAVVRYVRGKEHSRLPMPAAGDELGLRMNYFTQKDIVQKLALNEAPAPSKGTKKQR
uniref:Thioredoxin domain-containing protein n=1 Tax=Tetradesmus obliquus TaxID=3088 RepID=A0A383WA51_TETOB|eukprot:jgi/Sobl393_1/2845/SZX73979.1